jgi:hypothetical protein
MLKAKRKDESSSVDNPDGRNIAVFPNILKTASPDFREVNPYILVDFLHLLKGV